jgi:hypothetical protein
MARTGRVAMARGTRSSAAAAAGDAAPDTADSNISYSV